MLAKLLTNEDCHATIIYSTAFALFGGDVIDYEIETVIEGLESTFNIKLPQQNKDELGATIVLNANNQFYLYLETFINVCEAFNGRTIVFDTLRLPTLEDIAWGVSEAFMMQPPDAEEGNKFSREIQIFVGQLIADNGLLRPPPVLEFAEIPPINLENIEDWAKKALLDRSEQRYKQIEMYLKENLLELDRQLKIFQREINRYNPKVPVLEEQNV